ncbi:ketosteroid isomerase-like protein [Pelomonas saccharophila]|uniref:Ketosteroid isomerase-like protein n=1 Tax=Roseateles saccharophilus TaxID=304 RepID=A0ABU1YQ16_ROSSA|nr:nuclear transport factor 2 family protein [Roseateles saccharophilus]MDR7270838.1 ketosteroid isomerase-like protein [Roseateles saccharophilus]
MIMLRIRHFIVSALTAFALHPAMGASVQEQAAMAATQAACDAFRLRDLAALERLLAPEFTLISTTAEVQSRAQALQEVRDGDPQYERFENHSMTARVYGDTAVVQGITSLKGRSGGRPFALDVRFTDTLVRTDGRWTIVVSHVTRLPPQVSTN